MHLVDRYRLIRAATRALSTRLVETLSRTMLFEGADALRIREGNQIFHRDPGDEDVLFDYCVYEVRRGGDNAIERMLKSGAELSPEERAYLEAMSAARFSLYGVLEAQPGAGVIFADVLRHKPGEDPKPIPVIDVNFSNSALPGMVMAMRLFRVGEITMTTGGGQVVSEESLGIILGEMLDRAAGANGSDLTIDGVESDEITNVVRLICSTCLEEGCGIASRPVPPPKKDKKRARRRPKGQN